MKEIFNKDILLSKIFKLLCFSLIVIFIQLENNNLIVHAQNSQTDSLEQNRKYDDELTDWHMIPAGSSGGWRTAVSRAESNRIDIQRMQKERTNPYLPQPEHLLGNWWGLHSWLYNRGININFDNQNEFAGNISGYHQKKSTNTGAVDANIDIDWEVLIGDNWITNGLVGHMTVIGRYGSNLSAGLGENITQVQELYGAGGNVVAKLVNLYLDKHLLEDRMIMSFGRMDVGASFATSPIQCYFMNNGICGNPKPLSGQAAGFSAWPDSEWGINILFQATPQYFIRVGMYQVSRAAYSNRAGHRAGWAAVVRTGEDAGGEFPIEMIYQPKWGKHELTGHYKIGFAYDTSPYPVWGRSIYGGHITSANGIDQKWKRGRDEEWVLLDQMIQRNGPGDLDGLIGYLGFVHSNPKTFQRQNQFLAAIINTGFWKSRPMDGIGVLFVHQIMSREARKAQRYNIMSGFPIGDIVSGASGIQSAETTVELTYLIHIYDGVMFQPDFQYEIHPNAQKNISNAAFLGFKSRVDF